MKYIKITVVNGSEETLYSSNHGIQGNEFDQLQDTLAAFEDCLAEIHKIDPTEQALDLVETIEI